jgi:hypothetical protein
MLLGVRQHDFVEPVQWLYARIFHESYIAPLHWTKNAIRPSRAIWAHPLLPSRPGGLTQCGVGADDPTAPVCSPAFHNARDRSHGPSSLWRAYQFAYTRPGFIPIGSIPCHGDTISRGFATSRELPSLIKVTSTIYSCFVLPLNWPIYLRSPYTLDPKSGLVPLKEPQATGRLSSSTFHSPSSTASDLHLSFGSTTPNPILHLSTTAGRSHCACIEIK